MLLSEPILTGAAGACLVVGTVVGFAAGWPHAGSARLAAGFVVVLALACVGLSLAGVVAGRLGFWLDAAAPMIAAYGLGCLVGSTVRALRRA